MEYGTKYQHIATINTVELIDRLNKTAQLIEAGNRFIVQTHLISGTSAIIEYFIPEEDSPDGVGRVVIQGAGDVTVGVRGDADGSVAQPLTDHFQGHAGGKPHRRVPVTQVVDTDVGEPLVLIDDSFVGEPDAPPPAAVSVAGVLGESVPAGEDEGVEWLWREPEGSAWILYPPNYRK